MTIRVIESVHPDLKQAGHYDAILINPRKRLIETVRLPLYAPTHGDECADFGHELFKVLEAKWIETQVSWFPNGDHVAIQADVGDETWPSFELYGRRCFVNALVERFDQNGYENGPVPYVAPKSSVAELRQLVKWVAPMPESN
jgi:hypothetical protein